MPAETDPPNLGTEELSESGGRWADVLENRDGDPGKFEEALEGELAGPRREEEGRPDEEEKLEVHPNLLRQLLADPTAAHEILAARAVERHAHRAARDVALLREHNPGVTSRQLAIHFKRRYSRLARWEGAATGSAGIFGLPADLVGLAWLQARLVLSIAASYGHDMNDHVDRAVELLMIQGVHNSRELARRALITRSQRVVQRLILRHLRKQVLTLIKQLFRVVGIKFTRKALLEKGVPFIAIPLSAGVNEASTRLLANQAIKHYDTAIAS